MIDEGVKIVESVECSVFLDHVPFVVVGTLIVLKFKSFWFKITYTYRGFFFKLCPS